MAQNSLIVSGIINPTNALVKQELTDIYEAGAKALKSPGVDLQPVKREMLRLSDSEADLVIEACDMLFAALFEYEDGLWKEQNARNSVELVTGRVSIGRANAIIESLFYGPAARLLWLALDRAPIAYCGIARISPTMNIIDRTLKATPQK